MNSNVRRKLTLTFWDKVVEAQLNESEDIAIVDYKKQRL